MAKNVRAADPFAVEIQRLVRTVRRRLAEGGAVHAAVPGGGRLYLRAALPLLCVYRAPPGRPDAGTDDLATGVPAYLHVPAELPDERLARLVRAIAGVLRDEAGGLLLVEIRSAPAAPDAPLFRLRAPREPTLDPILMDVEGSLRRFRDDGLPAAVETDRGRLWPSGGRPALLSRAERRRLGCMALMLTVAAVYQRDGGAAVDRAAQRRIRRAVGRALREGFYRYSLGLAGVPAGRYLALGRQSFVQGVQRVDRRLAEAAATFDFLPLVTPIQTERAWRSFVARRYDRPPVFRYRALAFDPDLVKRRLYALRVERIEEPILAHLYREKRDELARRLTMLAARGSPAFLHDGLALYGAPDAALVRRARRLLAEIRPEDGRSRGRGALRADAVVHAARDAVEAYREADPNFAATVRIDPGLGSGVLVTRNVLNVGPDARVERRRLPALLHHEVGTHLVTYHNAIRQPLRIFALGLAGYDELQEGMAVLGEWLGGRVTRGRLRQLAGRVVAVRSVIDGADFVETFRLLRDEHGFAPHGAFVTAMRAHRGGGLAKDAVYLRGLLRVLDYIAGGQPLEPLFVGKIAVEHIPLVRELQRRGLIYPPAVLPAYLTDPDAQARLALLRERRPRLAALPTLGRGPSSSPPRPKR
ncbi:MAG: flavohemoglobin expression-modulating QEGLA motif protein [Planctomycetota bacterium]